MRFKESFTRKVLEKVNIVDIMKQYTQLEEKDGVFVGNCPLHKDEQQMMIVYPEKKTFKCYDCGQSGNIAVFLMLKHNVDFDKAIQYLAKKCGISPTEQDIDKTSNAVLKASLYAIYKDAAAYYTSRLQTEEGQEAVEYFKKRELTDETIKKFGLGYSPTQGTSLYKYLVAKGHTEENMLTAGLIRISETGPYDMFRGRMIVPIYDSNNQVIAFGGRVLNDEMKPKYLNSPESPIFNKSQTLYGLHDINGANRQYFLLCEGYMDVIALHQAGFKNSVATLGTAFTPTHIPVINQYTNNVILSFDSDGAGKKAATRTIKALENSTMGVRVLSMSPYKDPDEFIKALGKDEYTERIKRSLLKTDYQLKTLAEKYDLTDQEQKDEYLRKAVDFIIKQQDRKKIINEKQERIR